MASVKDAVNSRELEQKNQSQLIPEISRWIGIVIGSVIFAVGINQFLRPLHLYSGGMMGFSQLFTYLLHDRFGVVAGNIDLSGILYYLLNLPGIIIAFLKMPRRFFFKTLFTVSCITFLLTLVPIAPEPVLEETVANCMIAGLMAGVGVGLTLRMGACDGGMDLIGMLLIQKRNGMSVGRITLATNMLLYAVCLVLFDIPTVIYSLLYSAACSLMSDRIHTQNIDIQALVVTKRTDLETLEIELMGQMGHGLTRWKAVGSYTGDEETVFMTVVSKYEINRLKAIIHEYDPNAFVMIDEGVSVGGNYRRKLV